MSAPILCAVDRTPVAAEAVALAGLLARAKGSAVTLLHATDRRDAEPDPGELLSRLAARLQADGVAVRVETAEGDPAALILDRAASSTLVVMGTHGGHGVERLMLGSVAEAVLDRSPCPVATVRQTCGGRIAKIVCGTDLVDPAPLLAAATLAREAGATLAVLHAVAELPEEGAHSLVPASYRGSLLAEAHERLAAAVEAIDRTGLPIRQLVVPGRPHRALVRLADRERADLVVVGVHPHLFGSTAHHVVRSAGCPVLTVRPAPATEGAER